MQLDRLAAKQFTPPDTKVVAAERKCVGRQTIAALSTGAPTSLTIPAGAVAADIQADGGTIRITMDGATNPTSTVGTRIDDGAVYSIAGSLSQVKMLAMTSGVAAQIAYFDKG